MFALVLIVLNVLSHALVCHQSAVKAQYYLHKTSPGVSGLRTKYL